MTDADELRIIAKDGGRLSLVRGRLLQRCARGVLAFGHEVA